MSSLYDDLSDKLKGDLRLTKRGGARYDLSLLLFDARDSLRELWDAADIKVTEAKRKGHHPSERLEAATWAFPKPKGQSGAVSCSCYLCLDSDDQGYSLLVALRPGIGSVPIALHAKGLQGQQAGSILIQWSPRFPAVRYAPCRPPGHEDASVGLYIIRATAWQESA
jgi:hypothetical protein